MPNNMIDLFGITSQSGDIQVFAENTGFGTDPNLTKFGDNGAMTMEGEASGWSDNTSVFNIGATSPSNTPTYEDIGNGFLELNFAEGDIAFLKFHIKHDILVGSKMYPHIHFGMKSIPNAGETIKWKVEWVESERDSNVSFNAVPSEAILTYTAIGNETVASHFVTEVTDDEATIIPDVDSLVLFKVTREVGTYAGGVYGYTGDLHYQIGRVSTPNKAFPFV